MPTGRVSLGCTIYFSRNWYLRLSACLTLLTIYKGFYVGVATAIGQAVDIPILVQSLADSLALADVSAFVF